MAELAGVRQGSSVTSTWFNVQKPEVKNDEEKKKDIDIGNFLNGSRPCAYMS